MRPIRTDCVFCPKCGSKNVYGIGADIPEWVTSMEIASYENYQCEDCNETFEISASYEMTCFNFLNVDDDRDIYIQR